MDVRCTLLALGMRGCLQRTHDEDIEASHELHNILAGRDLALLYAFILVMVSSMDDMYMVYRVETHVMHTLDRGEVSDHTETMFGPSLHISLVAA